MNISQQVMCSQSFLKGLRVTYENASSEIDSPQKMGKKRMVPEVVYEGNQFALEDVADLEHWVFEMTCEQGGPGTVFSMKRTLKCGIMSSRKHLCDSGIAGARQRSLRGSQESQEP